MKKIFLIFLIFSSVHVFGQSEADFLLIQKDYVLNADGSCDLQCRQIVKYNTHVSFNRLYGETFIIYNPQYQQLKINESYTIQSSGNKVRAPSNAFNEVLPRFATDAPDYNHLREMVVTHTGLEIGATAYLDYTLHTNAGYQPELDQCLTLQEASPIKDCKISVTVPDGKKLSYQLHGIKTNAKTIKKGNSTSYEWTFKNIAASSKEYYQPEDGRNAPHLIFSTWESQSAALQWMALQMKVGDVSIVKSQANNTARNNKNNSYLGAAQVYDFVVNSVAYTPVPAEFSGYRLRGASQVLQSAYGTAAEKAALLLTSFSVLNLPAEPVAVYPSYYDGTTGSLNAIEGFAVCIAASGFNYVLSPIELTSLSLTASQPGYRYLTMENANVLATSNINSISLTMEMGVDKENIQTQSFLKLTGTFNPLIPVWLNESKAKNLLTAGSTDGITNMSASESSFSVNLEGKISAKENSSYYSFILPENRGSANSWNMHYLTPGRKTEVALPYPVNESYTYTIKFPEGMQPVNRTGTTVKENKVGKINITIEKDSSNSLKITRSLQLYNSIVPVSEYYGFAELIKLWENNNYRKVVFK